ncbi:hypothetical protein CROQUDRAFT_40478 [Cronartium quercuum f. sp. fusiforme G11]|uniref:Uncharacterized protein n=1 Tax=Cronartium quercuum f. sp. fusiforme G11 TaxID=708437 RepID=A0A9P6TET2_9BASI|nr:hypothetical protein CROQUDRAFT_40478 [Cronartium quercuum f. sp. fusiforme G11]
MPSIFHLPQWVYSLLIWAVWCVVPWSWVYSSTHLLGLILRRYQINLNIRPINFIIPYLIRSRPKPLLGSYALLEVIFSIYYFIRAKAAQRRIPQAQHDIEFLRSCISRIISSGLELDPNLKLNQVQLDQRISRARGFSSFDSLSSLSSCPTSISSYTPPNETCTQSLTSQPTSPSALISNQILPFDSPAAIDYRSHLVVWFGKCKYDEIKRENFREWMAWAFFNAHDIKVLDEFHLNLMDDFVEIFERRTGCQFPIGYNPKLKDRLMRLTLDPVKVTLRPFGFYSITNSLSWIVKQRMTHYGFKETQCTGRSNGLKYLIRKPKGWDQLPIYDRTAPFICIHGLGIGLIQYISLLNYLTHSEWGKSRPIMVPLQPSISLGFFDSQHLNPPSKEEMIDDIKEVLHKEKFNNIQTGIEIFGHSNGTIVAAWIIKSIPELIKRVCLVDPVCFCEEGHVCHNFLYAEPKTGLERLMRYFIGTELGVAKNLHRHFNWAANILWPVDVPGFVDGKRCSVFLAGNDAVLDAPRIRNYLLQNGMTESESKSEPFKGNSGLVMAWEAAHGESLVENGIHFQHIRRWLEKSD